jgi:hypothetical protein
MKTKTHRNILISVGLLFALTGLVAADKPHPIIITFDAPGAGTGPFQGTQPSAINPAGVICGVISDANRVFSSQCSRAREAGLI